MNNNQQSQGNLRGQEESQKALIFGEIGSKESAKGREQRFQMYSNPPASTSTEFSEELSSQAMDSQVTNSLGMQSVQQGVQSTQMDGQASQQQQVQSNSTQMPTDQELRQEYLDRFPTAYGQPIVAVRKDERGNLVGFKLQNGHILDYPQMLQAGFDGALQGLVVQPNREGELILRSVPDAHKENNLDNLPEF